MNGKPFFDSNVLIYTIVENDRRRLRAREMLAAGGTVSVQVLNEIVSVVRRKVKMSWSEVVDVLDGIGYFCPQALPVTIETHEAGLRIAARYGYGIFDSVIIASALEADSRILYSEDLQDGQVIDGRLTIRNPFRPAGLV